MLIQDLFFQCNYSNVRENSFYTICFSVGLKSNNKLNTNNINTKNTN